MLLALSGCSKSGEKAQVQESAKAPQAKPAGAPALPVQKQLSSVASAHAQLDFRNRTDPFKPYAPVVAPTPQPRSEQAAALPAGDLLPIQSFEVSKFKVAGIIAGLKENRALILDPNGKGYVVQEGMLIGSNNGRISKISATGIAVVESFKDERGKLRKRTIVLTLAKKR